MTAARRRVEPPTRAKTGTRRVADATARDGERRVCRIVVRLSVSHPVDGRSPRKTRRGCGAAFFWRARNSARIARTLEKCVSCESALGRVALVANAMGRGRLFPRSGQVRAEPRCLYGVNAIQIRSLQNRIRGPENASFLAPSEASSRPSRDGCADEPRRGSRAPMRPSLSPATRVRRACDRRHREVRSRLRREASRGVGRGALPSPRAPPAHPRPTREWSGPRVPASHREAAGLRKARQRFTQSVTCCAEVEAVGFAICKTSFNGIGDIRRPVANTRQPPNVSDAATTKRNTWTTLREQRQPVARTPRTAARHLAYTSPNCSGDKREAGTSAQRHRLDINQYRFWNRTLKHVP